MNQLSSPPTVADHAGSRAVVPASLLKESGLPRSEIGLELEYPVRVDSLARLTHIPFMFWIVEALRPRMIVELGVGRGNSYLALLQAASNLGLEVRCFGVDPWPGSSGEQCYGDLSAYHDPLYGAFSTLLRSSLDATATYFDDGAIDLLHVDGMRSYDSVSRDLKTWLPKMSARGVVMFHDTNVRGEESGAWKIWEDVRSRYPAFEFLHGNGLGVAYVGSDPTWGRLKALFDKQANPHYFRTYFARLGNSVHEHVALRAAEARGAKFADSTKTTHALEQQLREAQAKLARRDNLRQQTAMVMRLQREVSVLNRKKLEWEQILQSTSWRITGPLRWLVIKSRWMISRLFHS